MKTISVVNNKGGVAKTSSAANIGACLSHHGHKVLLVDTDPQANLTQHFGYYEDDVTTSINNAYESYIDKDRSAQVPVIKHSNELYIVPSDQKLKETEKRLVMVNNNQNVLRKLLDPIRDIFDYCIIDCPPSLGFLTDNALVASDQILLPIEAGMFSLNGIKNIINHLNEIKYDHNLNFEILGAFMTKYDVRLGISEAVRQEVQKQFGDKFFDRVIRTNVAIADAQANGEDVFTFSRTSNAALDYGDLTTQILKRLEYGKEAV
jgi:chromosome partitioning protein